MKPMDLPEATTTIDIAAPPDRVWEVLSDITVMPRFSTELLAVEWAGGSTGPALGAQFLGHNRNRAIGEWTTRSEIVAFDPPRVFGWAVGDSQKPAATWLFELQPLPSGTHLRYTARIGPGPSGVSMLIERTPDRAERIIEGRLGQFRNAMQATLEGIRDLAEGSGVAGPSG